MNYLTGSSKNSDAADEIQVFCILALDICFSISYIIQQEVKI